MTGRVFMIGMPGAGKTEVGRLVAERTARAFLDLDAEIETQAGISIVAIMNDAGEQEFRDLERTVLQHLADGPERVVIATGGGAPMDPLNRDLLLASGPG